MSPMTICPECERPITAGSPSGLCPNCLLKMGLAMNAQVDRADADADAELDATAARNGVGETLAHMAGPLGSLARRFPSLEILEPIGQGGMGVVHRARQIKLDRPVALKIIRPELAGELAFAERFSREARAMARLRHPGIINLYDYGEADGLYYLVMELVEGADLRQLIKRGPIAAESATLIAIQVCDALHYAHANGVVHRDIKPENVLLDANHRVRLADFGLAKLIGPLDGPDSLTRTRQILGTPHYMAPEQFTSAKQADPRVDVYSVGVLLYEMMTGHLPLGRFDLPSELVDVDEEMDEMVLKALHRDPQKRYATIAALRDDLLSYAESNFDWENAWSQLGRVEPVFSTRKKEAEEEDGGYFSMGVVVAGGFFLMYANRSIGHLPQEWMQDVGYAALAGLALLVFALLMGWFKAGGPRWSRKRASTSSASEEASVPPGHEPKPSAIDFASRAGDR